MCLIAAPSAGLGDFAILRIIVSRRANYFFAPNTKGNAFERPPRVVPFGLLRALLLCRGLRGGLRCFPCWLLGCFLGCHFSILPFRWVASSLQLETAVEK